MTKLFDYITNQKDPFEFIYEGILGAHGSEAQKILTEFYSEVSVDYGFHPDDDFEQIIDRMLDLMENV